MTPLDHVKGIWALSSCSWLIVWFFMQFSVKRFIVSRYKEETNLSQTAFFKNHIPFVLYFPDYLSAGFFGTHLMMCFWGWKIFGKRKVFKDIDDPDTVIRHFSPKEIRRVKFEFISTLIVCGHGVAYYIFHAIWPEVFN